MGAAMMSGGPPRDLGLQRAVPGDGVRAGVLDAGHRRWLRRRFGGSGFGGGGFAGLGGGPSRGRRTRSSRAPNVERGRLTPEHTDYDALSASGEEPTVLAFALCLTRTRYAVYEVLNESDHATYVYRCVHTG